jgi:hypothetical protein
MVNVELDGTKFDNFENWFDSQNDFPCRAARRAELAGLTFGRPDQAQPQASGSQCGCNLCGKTRPLFGFIEDVEAATVEDEMEGAIRRVSGEKVQGQETATEIATIQLRHGLFDRKWRNVDTQDLEAALGEPKSVRPCPGANFKCSRGPNATRSDELNQKRLRLSRVPRKRSRGVALIPQGVRHDPSSLTPKVSW